MITLSAALLAWHSVSQVVFSSRDTTTSTVMSGMLYERKEQVKIHIFNLQKIEKLNGT